MSVFGHQVHWPHFPAVRLLSAKDISDMTQQAVQKVGPNQWAILIVGGILTFCMGIAASGVIGLVSNSSQLTKMSQDVSNMQEQMKTMQETLNDNRHYADSNYVRQDRFDQFIKAYDQNHADGVAARASEDAKLDQIMERINNFPQTYRRK